MSPRLISTALAGLLLTSCALLSDPPTEQLYRFGTGVGPGAAPVAASETPAIRLGIDPGAFPREATGVRILTTEGAQVSYLAAARWAAPAEILFENTLVRAFDGAAPDVTMYPRGATGTAAALLRVDVRQFEAVYDQGPQAPPVVRIRLSARLNDRIERTVLGEREFTAESRAVDNRVTAVVAAYDQAVNEVARSVSAWSVDTARRGGVGRARADAG